MIDIIQKHNNGIDVISMKSDELEVVVSNYGCTIMKVLMFDCQGHRDDVVLGYDHIEDYYDRDAYLGALVGRVANRIGRGTFSLNGQTYHLAINNGPNHLHGGIKGFSYRIFDYEVKNQETIEFHYVSANGEEGYPGELNLTVTYTLKKDTLQIRYQATCSQDTLINITNHSYFNLSGHKEDITSHLLRVNANQFACIDSDGLPTGVLRDVRESPFDFREGAYIGERVIQEDEQLRLGNGFDHPFIFDSKQNQVVLKHEKSGRQLTVSSSLPGAQIYTANYLDGRLGKYGEHYHARDGICIETQYMPDAINIEKNPTTILKKGDLYDGYTSYKFEVIKS